jgi:chromate transporter
MLLRYPVSVSPATSPARRPSALSVFAVFLRLGCTSFGGPVAHLGYFRKEFVVRRRWLTEPTYAELLALAHALPGPGSSQVGFAIGLLRAGWRGALAAWLGFTLPSALLMLAVALGHSLFTTPTGVRLSHGLQLVAVAVVAQAVVSMQRTLAPDVPRLILAALSAAALLTLPVSLANATVIALAALIGWAIFRHKTLPPLADAAIAFPRFAGLVAAAFFFALLAVALVPAASTTLTPFTLTAAFYRSGALVFGGGHVVLPLLERAFVLPHWIGEPAFLTGYGAAQAMPGPLFTFGAYLAATMAPPAHAAAYAFLGLAGIFLPGLLAMAAVLPFWTTLRSNQRLRAALLGVNASVVGILAAALIHPLWTSTIHTPADILIAAVAFIGLQFGRVQPWMIVAAAALLALVPGLRL